MKVRIEDILDEHGEHHRNADRDLVYRSYLMSGRAHKDQKRHTGEPYLIHPLEVSFMLAQLGMDSVAVAAGLLHDVLEDSLVSKEEMLELFGEEVTHIVDGLTKIPKMEEVSQEENQARNFRKMLLATEDDLRVIIVKLTDRLHNLRTLFGHPKEEKRKKIAMETKEIYVPFAHRLGFGAMKQEMEEECFKYLHPQVYTELKQSVEQEIPMNHEAIMAVKELIELALTEEGVPARIEWRVKNIASIHRKSRILQKQQSIEYTYHDYIAFRIITDKVPDCYRILGVVHKLWKPVHGQFDDYIAIPKANDYQSLHTVVMDQQNKFEIQIRTEKMHEIAERGVAAHWRYKDDEKESDSGWMEKYYEWMRDLLESDRDAEDPVLSFRELRRDLIPDEIYVFTPKSKLIALPVDATPVDFAYAIHTDVGHQCSGAKVDGMIVPLDTPLKSGDTVEILTTKGKEPSRDWLNVAKTGRARNKIRSYINKKEKHRSIEIGAKLLDKELHARGLSVKRFVAHDKFQDELKSNGINSLEELQSAVYYGRLSARSFISRLFPRESDKQKQSLASRLRQGVQRALGIADSNIRITGAEDLFTYMAPCCSPVVGEKIVGYITRGKGVAIHRADCTNALNFEPERIISVDWEKSGEDFTSVVLILETENKQGMISVITGILDKAGINILQFSAGIETFDKAGEISMTIEVKDIHHLNAIMSQLRKVQGILSVRRV